MSNVLEFIVRVRDNASGPIEDVSKTTKGAAQSAEVAETKYTELASKFHLVGMAAAAAQKLISGIVGPLKKLGAEGIAAGAQMEGFETRLTVLMGSAADAEQRLNELFKIGTTTPFELPGLIEAEVNLRALGVNAEKTLPLVMDFAGAMGTDLASAAVEVGRAMQFGAGAVETISGRALRAQVELRTGADALKMSTEEFREAMIETLTDPDGIFAGGTEKLAATFDGMLSNLKDAFFKFSKDVGDAGLFDVAKETLRAMLELIDQNRDGLVVMSRVISEGLAKGLLGTVKMAGFLLDSFLAVGAAILDISKAYTEFVLGAANVARAIPGLGQFAVSDEELKALTERQKRLEDTKETLLDMGGFATIAADTVSKIEDRVAKLPKGAAGIAGARVSGPEVKPIKIGDGEQEAIDPVDLSGTLDDLANLQETLDKLAQEMKELPFRIARGFVDALDSPSTALAQALGPAGGIVSAVADLGAKNPKQIANEFRQFFRNIVKGLVKVIPELLATLPEILARNIPFLIEGVIRALPRIVSAFVVRLPLAFAKGLARWFVGALKKIREVFSPGKIFRPETEKGRRRLAVATLGISEAVRGIRKVIKGSRQTGGFTTGGDGLYMLHAGERVVPSTGASTGTMAAASNIAPGQIINISTNVVDPNSIDQLGRQLDRQFGSRGRSFGVGLFNQLDAVAGRVT